jgi:hypothetical protein
MLLQAAEAPMEFGALQNFPGQCCIKRRRQRGNQAYAYETQYQ